MDRWHAFGRARFVLLALFLSVLAIATLSSSSMNLSAQGGAWEGKYWNNRNLSGAPVLTRQDASINFDWGAGSPASGIGADEFSAQWTQTANLPAGTYRFTATTDDGMRVWIDNVMIIDAWFDSQQHTITADVFLGAGNHTIVVQYYEAGGLAVAKMNYVLLGGRPRRRSATRPGTTNTSPTPTSAGHQRLPAQHRPLISIGALAPRLRASRQISSRCAGCEMSPWKRVGIGSPLPLTTAFACG